MNQELTQSELKRQLHYNPLTGIFTRLVSNCGRVKVGDVAGFDHTGTIGKKYRRIRVSGYQYTAHRLAVLYMNGSLPLEHVDHEDGNGLHNWWTNIRCVTRTENNRNARLRKDNSSGCVGVHFNKMANKWQAQIMVNGKRLHLGLFSDLNAAIAARQTANIKYGFHENHGKVRPL